MSDTYYAQATSLAAEQTRAMAAENIHSITVPGVAGDGVTDDTAAIQALINQVRTLSTTALELQVSSPVTGGSVYINGLVQIQSSNTTLRFLSPVILGPSGSVQITGSLSLSSNAFLASAANAGDTSLALATGSVAALGIAANSQLAIHGNRSSAGVAFSHETVTVASVSGDTVTLAQPVQASYSPLYTNSYGTGNSWDSVHTEVALIIGTSMSGGATRGSTVVAVASTSGLAAGNFVLLQDSDVNWDPTLQAAQPGNNQHREIAEIRAVVDSTHLRLSHPLHHTYDMSAAPFLTALAPVVNSEITGLSATFTGGVHTGTVNYAVYLEYAAGCRVTDTTLAGTGPLGSSPWGSSWYSQAIRVSYGYKCLVQNSVIRDPAVTSSGNGYGITLYASTQCTVDKAWFTSCRHDVLLFNGACGNRVTNITSEDVGYSSLDSHGGGCCDNVYEVATIHGGTGQPMLSWSTGSGPTYDTAPVKAACRAGDPSHSPGDSNITFRNITAVNFPGCMLEVVPDSSDITLESFRGIGCAGLLNISPAGLNSGSSSQLLAASSVRCRSGVMADMTLSPVTVSGEASGTYSGTTYVSAVVLSDVRFVRAQLGITTYSNAGITGLELDRIAWENPQIATGGYGLTANGVTSLVVRDGYWASLPRAFSLTSCPGFVIAKNIISGLTDTGAIVVRDGGGNTAGQLAANVYAGMQPSASIGTASTGIVYDWQFPSYVSDSPLKHGWLEWNFPPDDISSSSTAMISGTRYVLKFTANTSQPVDTINIQVGTAGSSLTSGQNLAALFDSSGNQLAITGDQSTAWASTGMKAMTLGSTVTLKQGQDYEVVLLSVGTTPPLLARGTSTTVAANAGLVASSYRFAVNGTSVTTIPSTLTLSSNLGTGASGFWFSLSEV